jgi:hypothetical protein
MMDHMMGGGMMWGMGLIGLLVIIVLVLGAAALVKYLFFTKRPGAGALQNPQPLLASGVRNICFRLIAGCGSISQASGNASW